MSSNGIAPGMDAFGRTQTAAAPAVGGYLPSLSSSRGSQPPARSRKRTSFTLYDGVDSSLTSTVSKFPEGSEEGSLELNKSMDRLRGKNENQNRSRIITANAIPVPAGALRRSKSFTIQGAALPDDEHRRDHSDSVCHHVIEHIGSRDNSDGGDCPSVVMATEGEVKENVGDDAATANGGSRGGHDNNGDIGVERRDFKRVKSEPMLLALDDEASATLAVDVIGVEQRRQQQQHWQQGQVDGVVTEDEEGALRDDPSEPSKLSLDPPEFGTAPHPDACSPDVDPDSYISLLSQSYVGYAPRVVPALSLPSPGFFPLISEDRLASYGLEVVAAVRENDLDSAMRLHRQQGQSLDCCNRFGESLIHMSCRRGYISMVRYLLEEADVGLRIRDDCGRTPLHDCFWNRDPQFEIADMILRRDACLLLVSDKRGHTPFAYARREHWDMWRRFLWDRRECLVRALGSEEAREVFRGNGLQ